MKKFVFLIALALILVIGGMSQAGVCPAGQFVQNADGSIAFLPDPTIAVAVPTYRGFSRAFFNTYRVGGAPFGYVPFHDEVFRGLRGQVAFDVPRFRREAVVLAPHAVKVKEVFRR